MGDYALVKDFAIIMAVAGGITLLFRWLHQPPILGYLIAGVIIGPYTLPWSPVKDVETIKLLADLGLVLLLFGIGLEFSWSKIRNVGLSVIVIGIMEIFTMMSIGYGLGRAMGWSSMEAIFLGAAMQVSSSAIIVKILSDAGKLGNLPSRIIVGILVVEDFAAVIILAILSGIGSIDTPAKVGPGEIGWLLVRLLAFVVASLVVGAILVPRIMDFTHRFHSKEAFVIISLGLCFVMALIGDYLGLSAAIGAFLVGAVVADTKQSEEVIGVITPIRDMFAALFFVTIGMLIDFAGFTQWILPVVAVVVLFILGKIIANTAASFTAGYDGRTSLNVGMGMPQMGEFSLTIARVGKASEYVTAPLYQVVALATAITCFTSPYVTRSADRVADFIDRKSPRLLRIYVASLADWLHALRSNFSRDTASARIVQHSGRVILINLLIVLVLVSSGTFALKFVDNLADWSNIGRSVVALMISSLVLLLSLPCLLVIWRSLHDLVNEATRYMISRRRSAKGWRQEAIRHVLSDSILIVISVLLALWFIPLIAGLFYVGSWAVTVPLFLLAIVVYLVSTSMWHIHTQVERTFSRTLLGDEYISTSEAAALLGTTRSTVEKLARETRLPAIRVGKRWRISKLDAERLSEACFSGPDSCSDSADEGKVASVINPTPTPGGKDRPQLSPEKKNGSGQIDP